MKALIDYTDGEHEGTIGIAVTWVERGELADMGPDLGAEKGTGRVPYYLHAVISNEGGTPAQRDVRAAVADPFLIG